MTDVGSRWLVIVHNPELARWERADLARAGLLAGAPQVACADGGLVHALRWGLRPTLWVGDMDSLARSAGLRLLRHPALSETHVERLPRDKDETDLQAVLARIGPVPGQHLAVLGATGGRFDQSLANLLLLFPLAEKGVQVRAVSPGQEVRFLVAGYPLSLAGPPGTVFSVIPLLPTVRGYRVRGARWEAGPVDLVFGDTLAVSNELVAGPVHLELAEGVALVATNGILEPPG